MDKKILAVVVESCIEELPRTRSGRGYILLGENEKPIPLKSICEKISKILIEKHISPFYKKEPAPSYQPVYLRILRSVLYENSRKVVLTNKLMYISDDEVKERIVLKIINTLETFESLQDSVKNLIYLLQSVPKE